jgi:hypothetical protein
MKSRLPLLLSIAALLVAALGPGVVGSAARDAGATIVKRAQFAYRANYSRFARDAAHATRADRSGTARKAARANVAANAGTVNGIGASRTPTPNMLLPLDANGKLPSSIGAVGPAGKQGSPGPPGVSGLVRVTADSGSNSNTLKNQSVSCPSGKRLLGGGASVNTTSNSLAVTNSSPSSDLKTWTAQAQETAAFAGNWRVTAYAICATVTG